MWKIIVLQPRAKYSFTVRGAVFVSISNNMHAAQMAPLINTVTGNLNVRVSVCVSV